jgi:hypothetical protein
MTPTRTGWQDGSNQTGSYFVGNAFAKPGSANPGDWMILVLAAASTIELVDAQGWTLIGARSQTNTLYSTVWAKILEEGETGWTMTASTGAAITYSLMWGTGAAPVNEWDIGSWMSRGSTGTSTTNVANPGITTTTDNSLVITVSTERTIATETDITSMSGASAWYFVGHTDGMIETHSVGYEEQTSAGATGTVTVTYPNGQSTNGNIIQFALPPGGTVGTDLAVDPAFRAASDHISSSGETSFSVARPGLAQIDDYGIIVISWSLGGADPVFTFPAGWVELLPVTSTNNIVTTMWGKAYEIGDSDPISITSTQSKYWYAVGAWFDGTKIGGVETIGTYGTRAGSQATITAPAVTAVASNRRIVSVFTHRTLALPTFDSVSYGELVHHSSTTDSTVNGCGISFVERMFGGSAVTSNIATYSSASTNALGVQFVMLTLDYVEPVPVWLFTM